MVHVKNTKDIANISLYLPRRLIFHGYFIPFIVLYVSIFFVWLQFWGFNESFEAAIIALAIVGCIQILVCLFCHWFVSVKCFMTCNREKSMEIATVVKVTPTPNNGWADLVSLNKSKDLVTGKPCYWFIFQKSKYTYYDNEKAFVPVQFPVNETIQYYNEWKGHQTEEEISIVNNNLGDNKMVMDIPKFGDLFIERATAPFFVFQVFCVGLWCLDEYWYYSLFTLFMLIVFECTLVQQQLKNMTEIRAMGNKPYKIMTYRCKKWVQISTDELVAGDVVSLTRLKSDNLIPCDMILLRGTCIVDESMLTGESVPVMKESIEDVDETLRLNMEEEDKLHILSGGTKIVQHTPPIKSNTKFKSPDNGCIAFVLRTGFNSSQGRLLKTILYSVKRVTANNLETFMFILFLLIFAIVAASYVWIKGTQDPKRNRYKLFLECTLILTSVVPPELPIELSLAVNSSLLALTKLLVFCTEPFRIPFAGKVDICCFDKTGTLTKDEMVVDGVAGLSLDKAATSTALLLVSDCPIKTVQVLASCHSLVQIDRDLIGDPLEKAILESVNWTLSKGDVVFPGSSHKTHPLKIYYRFHFSSTLQRMSVISGFSRSGFSDISYVAAVKGSPEIMKDRFIDAPKDYEQIYLDLSRRGSRVLALGHKDLGMLSHQAVRDIKRQDIEADLSFCGFVVISCPLKRDTKAVVKEILQSSHQMTMITGDNPLTACHVSRELKFIRKPHTLILTKPNSFSDSWHWQSIDNTVLLPWNISTKFNEMVSKYDFCLTGEGIKFLEDVEGRLLQRLLPVVRVYARVAPKQKEQIVVGLKNLGYVTLMCGDGTNDVGALKQAHIGVALLSNAPDPVSAQSIIDESAKEAHQDTTNPERLKSLKKPNSSVTNRALKLSNNHSDRSKTIATTGDAQSSNINKNNNLSNYQNNPQMKAAKQKLNSLMTEIEKEEKAQVVHLGDASIAAPFTMKMSSIRGVSHIIKQGRCTLVTTLQMFKILALNALILAYSQSVLYLDGVKFSDAQATIQALLLAGCFLFISRSKPLKELSKERPLPNIFNAYTLLTVLAQFSVHFYSLYTLSDAAHQFMSIRSNLSLTPSNSSVLNVTLNASSLDSNTTLGALNSTMVGDLESDFQPNILNTVVYIISLAMQTTTFAVNYKGHPFMESLKDNRPLLTSILVSVVGIMLLASGCVPDAAEQFKIVALPVDLQYLVQKMLIIDFVGSFLIDRILHFIFARSFIKGTY